MQKEPTGRGSGAGKAAIARSENRANVIEAGESTANIEHGPDEIADNVVKESISAHAINKEMDSVVGLLMPL